MNEAPVNNLTLIIFLYLLTNDKPLKLVAYDWSDTSKEQLSTYAGMTERWINGTQKNYVDIEEDEIEFDDSVINGTQENYVDIEEDEIEFDDSVINETQEKCVDIKTPKSRHPTIIFSVTNRELLYERLKNYADELNRGIYTDIDSISVLRKELIKTRNKRKTLSYYPVYDAQFIPCIFSDYFKYEEFITRVCIETRWDEDEDYYPILIFKYNEDGITKVFDKRALDCFEWEICVNLKKYLKPKTTMKTLKTLKNKKNKEPHFSPMQQKLYEYIEAHVKSTNTLRIEEGLLKADFRNLNAIICKLNKQYKEITQCNDKLIRFDKRNGYYIIHNHWKINLQRLSVPSEIPGY